MLLFRDNKIISIDDTEDDKSNIIAIEEKNTDSMIRDRIYKLFSESEGYIFRVTQSPYADDSGLNGGIDGYHRTIASAILGAITYKKKVFNGNVEIKR